MVIKNNQLKMINFYNSQENVVVRVALGNIESYDDFLNENIDENMQESLLVASLSLFDAYQKKGIREDSIKRAILKYRIRNATRCTPYGLFSGVGIIKTSKQTKIELGDKMINKRARIDMKWLFRYISLLLADKSIIMHLKIKFNSTCYVSGNRMINPNFHSNGNDEFRVSRSYSIRYNEVIEFIMSISQDYTNYDDIIKNTSKNFNVDEEKVKQMVDELIKYGFFILEILPPLINTNATKYMLQVLDKRLGENPYSCFLKELDKKIHVYNQTSIGEGIDLYKNIIQDMKTVYDEKEYLQVDTKINFCNQTISDKVVQELNKTVNFLTKFAAGYNEQEYLLQYKNDFLEKYGYNTEVLILEMLDPNFGIGIPANYKNSQRNHISYSLKNDIVTEMNYILCNKALIALENEESIIYITDEDLNKFDAFDIKSEDLQNTLDIVVQILGENEEKIDNGDFNLLLSGCISSAGGLNLLGRFSDMFWEERKYDQTILECEQQLIGQDYVIAELVEIFNKGRTANVDMNMNSCEYQICIGCNPCDTKYNIELGDIYIGIDKSTNKFYAKSRKLNKRIYARTTHMLNNFFGSNSYRFLRDISTLGSKFQFGEIVSSLGNSLWKHFPRIMYGKTILCPEKWRYDNINTKNFDVWDDYFTMWMKDNNVPQYVNYSISDHYLRLNLGIREYRELLYYESLKESVITLQENFVSEKNIWLKDENGSRHCSEMVFSFCKEMNYKNSKLKTQNRCMPKPYYYSDTGRTLFPGEDGWYYYKMYGMKGREDEFIGIDLQEFTYNLTKKNIIDKHFFIRYRDDRYHTRVRFHVNRDKNAEFHDEFNCWILKEKVKGLITDLSSAVYEREIERYGGYDLIVLAEKVFWKDSLFVEKIKEMKYNRKINLSDEEIGVWSVWGILHSFDMEYNDALNWLSYSVEKWEYRDLYKKNEKKYRNSLKSDFGIVDEIKQLYMDRNKTIRNFYYLIKSAEKNKILTNTVDNILSSLIHMFCNRYAANNVWEKQIKVLTRHALYSEISYNRFLDKQI